MARRSRAPRIHGPKALRLRIARDPAWATWVGNLAVRAMGMTAAGRPLARPPRTADRDQATSEQLGTPKPA